MFYVCLHVCFWGLVWFCNWPVGKFGISNIDRSRMSDISKNLSWPFSGSWEGMEGR